MLYTRVCLLLLLWKRLRVYRPQHHCPGGGRFCAGHAHGRGVRGRYSDTTPIVVPITSPETTSSTRRFCWRPSAVSFDATGCVLPNSLEVIDDAGTFSFAR